MKKSLLENNFSWVRALLLMLIFSMHFVGYSQKRPALDSLITALAKCKQDTCSISTNIRIARKYIYWREFDKAQSCLEKARQGLLKKEYIAGKADYYRAIGYFYFNKGDYDSSLVNYQKSEQLWNKSGNLQELASVELSIGSIYFYKGEYDAALKIYTTCAEIKKKTKDMGALSDLYSNMGGIYLYMGNNDKAKENFEIALDIARKYKMNLRIAQAQSNLSGVAVAKLKYADALGLLFEALKINETENNIPGMQTNYSNIAVCFLNQNKTSEASEYANKSLELCSKVGDKRALSEAYSLLGSIYGRDRKYDQAYKSFDQALQIKIQIGEKRGIANSYISLAQVVNDRDSNSVLAMDYLRKAEELFMQMSDDGGLAESYKLMGSVLLKDKKYDEAVKSITKSLEISKKSNLTGELVAGYNLLFKIYKEKGDYEKSIECLQTYSKYKDSLKIEENSKKSLELKYNYEFEKKQELSKAIFEKDKALSQLILQREQEKLLMAERDNAIQEYDIEKARYALKQKEAIGMKQQNEINLLSKDVLLKETEAKRKDAELERQATIRYAMSTGLILLAALAFVITRNLIINKRKNQIILEQKTIVEQRNLEIQKQKELIEEKQKEVLDSINYAKRIQYTLLAHTDFLKQNLNDHFVLFKPKDIVSGDFYWAAKVKSKFYIAVCDSTGHGVPGAFMSLLSIGFLSEAINEKGIDKPGDIFNYVRERLISNISREGQKDGFDGILLCLDGKSGEKTYASANNAPILIDGNGLIELQKDRMPVGMGERKEPFQTYTIEAEKGTMLYLYTDGYADQFGGPKGKKFKYKKLNEFLLANHKSDSETQKVKLDTEFKNWKGELEQVDDICVIGLKL